MNMNENELIADFMGADIASVVANYGEPIKVYIAPEKGRAILAQYDKSWDWLMPVVEKIKDLGFDVNFNLNASNVPSSAAACWIVSVPEGKVNPSIIESDLLKAVYKAVVEFIKWHK